MKNLLLLSGIFLFTVVRSFAQEVKVKTNKLEYKFDEVIELSFQLNATFDSITGIDLNNFEVINGPNKSSSITILNGVRTEIETRDFRLKPLESGQILIHCPIFHKNGKTMQGEPIEITVAKSVLTEEELKEKEFEEFITESFKPKGTSRIIFHQNKAYIEVFGDFEWEYKRRLTNKELEIIKQLK